VTGPPGAGKSTVAPLVADGFASSVLIQGDWFFGRWRRGAIDPWLPEAKPQTTIAAAAAAATAGTFARADCTVVYDGFIPPRDLPGFAALAGVAAIQYAVLLPSEATCVKRVWSRTRHGFTSEDGTRAMYRDFADQALTVKHRVTHAEETPHDAANRILDAISAGTLRWTKPRALRVTRQQPQLIRVPFRPLRPRPIAVGERRGGGRVDHLRM
jgi:adenylate kinase family enzyme